jgi:hypothetical protein
MLGLALSAVLLTGSGGLLADGAATGARLLEPSPLELGLRLELERLEAERPSLGWPLALTSTGGGLVLAGVGLVVGSVVAFPRAPDALIPPLEGTPYAIAGLISVGVGVLLVVVAGERLANAINLRRTLDARSSVLRLQLLAAERARTPPDPSADLPADAPTRARLAAPIPVP